MFEIVLDIFGTPLLVVVAFLFGYIYRNFLLIREIKQAVNKLNAGVNQQLSKTGADDKILGIKNINKLKHEIINNVHYFFLEDDNTFVCQGITLTEAAVNYTIKNGSDILGHFQHPELKKSYCFVNNQCLEFINE